MRTWQDNAREFAALDKGEGWPFAVLVACSVEKGTSAHRPASIDAGEKVSARMFAETASTGDSRVRRYLDAWDKAAAAGLVLPAAELSPADVGIPLPEADFGDFYTAALSGGRQYGNVAEAVRTIEKRGVEAIVEALTPEQRVEIAVTATKRVTTEQQEEIIAVTTRGEHEARVREVGKKLQTADDRHNEQAKQNHIVRSFYISTALDIAEKELRTALAESEGVDFTPEERELYTVKSARLRATHNLLDLRISGSIEVDWDAELTKIGSAS
jgi:hypothetical protein